MTYNFILNGEDVSVNTSAEDRLVNILREIFFLTGTKAGCCNGNCGSCTVIFNGEAVQACLVPAFRLHGSEVITIEGFSQTEEYSDIVSGFLEAGLETCGFCDTGKILMTETLLFRKEQPSTEEILSAFRENKCRCTDPDALVRAVRAVIRHRRGRLYGRAR